MTRDGCLRHRMGRIFSRLAGIRGGVHQTIDNPDVKKALEEYQCAVNRYNFSDLSDPRVENVCFLERQLAYARLQLALAKARIIEGADPALDYSCFESLTKFIKECG
jgi:hypothetical protein